MIRIAHVGIAVENLDKFMRMFKDIFGEDPGDIIDVRGHKIKVAFYPESGKNRSAIELLEPTSEDSSIKKFIEKNGSGLHHIAFVVEDIDSILAGLKNKGYKLIDEVPRIGALGHKIAFIHPSSTGGILIELQES